jgi:hypothetical protein
VPCPIWTRGSTTPSARPPATNSSTAVIAWPNLDDLRKHVLETLCRHDQLDVAGKIHRGSGNSSLLLRTDLRMIMFYEQETATKGEGTMNQADEAISWVVYKMTLHGKQDPVNAVCEQAEWEELELGRPGYHTLVRAGFTNESETEQLARGTSGDPISRRSLLR